jgi:hypothetical protein
MGWSPLVQRAWDVGIFAYVIRVFGMGPKSEQEFFLFHIHLPHIATHRGSLIILFKKPSFTMWSFPRMA